MSERGSIKVITPKKGQHNSKKQKPTKSWTGYFGEYHDLFTFKMVPVSQAWIDTLAEEVRDWSMLSNSYRMSDFYNKKGIAKSSYFAFKDRSKNLQAAHEFAMANIASRREMGATILPLKLNPSMILSSMCIYDEDWRAESERKAALTKDTSNGEQKIVIIETMPETAIVPAKKDKQKQ